MRSTKDLILRLLIITVVLSGLMGCGSPGESSPGETAKKEETSQKAAVIKESTFKVTPLQAEVYSKDEHVRIKVSDILNLEELGISSADLLDYQIFLYVHPLNGGGWFRQNPVAASTKWTANAFLGGIGPHTATDGESFQVAAFMANQSLPGEVMEPRILRDMEGVHMISEIRTMTVRR